MTKENGAPIAPKAPRVRNKEVDRAAFEKRMAKRVMQPPKPVIEKTCCRCQETKPPSEFGRQVVAPDGLNYACKACIKIQSEARKDKAAANSKRWYQENKERRLSVGRAWVEANQEKRNTQQKLYREENKESIRAGIKRSIAKKPEQYRKNQAEWCKNNPDRRKIITDRHKKNNPPNPAQVAVWNKNYRLKNPEAMRAIYRNRRARKRNAEGKHTAKEILNLLSHQRGKCAACGVSIRKAYHADHIMPLVKGGSNWISNIQLLCPHCNLCKHAKDPIDWAQENGRLL